ncbi:nucleoside triphosphate pyrophosphohydrolase family protein [Mammaliicoccus vitulinus]|uniref:Nucleotide pyrophosphohydrolase n=1 Tax=Mammaliicoccus vitulinus TaxID=71237 RepID=A0A2T4PRJ5_9STAP|nr:nucleoside triphosphate pyrophosphohydrolase family protein [Mammaliicoccus vitulinus]MBM6630076.1 nucleoside triphosphate pyrophosphohydrolase family protein [Mammaliicoccus vitulinus]MBO3076984.1 nucleoside triphosphate pyrophosphohydrolase family protein [Mammaliicoccus vitulinus]MEB7656648.1 nucleoside triphosphate pyrophosphohydrolase family protein [Mammaliicoccus vitulinus]PTI28654.1 nucleotide pyrophosphohydrolase [Mammaliicoccus vitulinus]PTI37285.1 nucleotide pyrophosphohydrolase 
MELNEYQQLALRTMSDIRRDPEQSLINGALGLTGEAGEVADIVKKHVFHGHELDEQELKKELGDVLWYIACCAKALDMDLNDIAMSNIAKLEKRYPNGFTKEDSLNRKD